MSGNRGYFLHMCYSIAGEETLLCAFYGEIGLFWGHIEQYCLKVCKTVDLAR